MYVGVGVVLAVFGILWTLLGPASNVTYQTVEGISVFAALYVIAQAAERLTEWSVEGLALLPTSPEKRKEEGLLKLRAANSTLNGNPTLADFGPQLVASDPKNLREAVGSTLATTQDATTKKVEGEKEVKEARRDLRFFAGGLSVTLCALGVNALNYNLLTHVGAEEVNSDLGRLVTVFAAAGGTKTLHELIGRVQKAKESKEAEAQG